MHAVSIRDAIYVRQHLTFYMYSLRNNLTPFHTTVPACSQNGVLKVDLNVIDRYRLSIIVDTYSSLSEHNCTFSESFR
jgi:hypothetical protein